MFLGPCCGNELESIAPILAKENQFMLSLCSSTAALFHRSNGKLLSPVFSVEAESEFMAKHIETRGADRIAIIYFNNTFSIAHEIAFRRALRKAVATTYTFDTMDPEAVRSIAVKLRQNPPDAIYLPDVTPFLLSFAKLAANAGLGKIPLYSIHAAQTEEIIVAEGTFIEDLIYSHPDTGEESADAYYSRLASVLIDEAVGKCADDVGCVRDYLFKTYPFDSNGTMTSTLILKSVKKGKFVPVGTSDPVGP